MATILLPLDGSALAERAIPAALAQLRPGDQLVLVRVTEPYYPDLGVPPSPLFQQPSLHVSEEEAAAYLAGQAQACRERGFSVSEKVMVGIARDSIPQAARQVEADLIVMTSHGYSGAHRWLLGSVAEAVAREAPCPVWLVRCTALSDPVAPTPVGRALIALDASPLSERGLDFAVDWLRARPADGPAPELVLYSATGLAEPGGEAGPEPVARRELLAAAQAYLDGLAGRLEQRGWKVRTRVEDRPSAPGILEAAEREQVDLIVLGSHGRTGLNRWFWGSVAEQVFRHATCPVLLVNSLAAVPSAVRSP